MKIGDLRRSLFVAHPCKWNGIVRDKTAEFENRDGEANEAIVMRELLRLIRENAELDHQFAGNRVHSLFA